MDHTIFLFLTHTATLEQQFTIFAGSDYQHTGNLPKLAIFSPPLVPFGQPQKQVAKVPAVGCKQWISLRFLYKCKDYIHSLHNH